MRYLILILGDQLDRQSSVWDDFDPAQDSILMAELPAESTRVWSHRARIAMFLAAMRHYAAELRGKGWLLRHYRLGTHPHQDFAALLAAELATLQPQRLRVVEPGEWGVEQAIVTAAQAAGVPLDILVDRHFLVSKAAFAQWAEGRRELRMEHFYRHQRRRLGVLMDGTEPVGGRWNLDAENRQSFSAQGPGWIAPPRRFAADAITAQTLADVAAHFPQHPGSLDAFDWPLTPQEAETALLDFIQHRLAGFGHYQDAMWTGEAWLFHSRLSAALNLKLIDPRRVIQAAETALRERRAPLAAVEGFIRQILGWREYVRGLYWQRMPQYLDDNALGAVEPLPAWYWSGETEMRCLRECIGQTLQLGYAHHIQRLMVTGLYALLLGVRPHEVHEWYLAVYVDAVEWVELPNTIGMSQYADGGYMASKPYCASGRYIQRMSNYCSQCRFRPDRAQGDDACPFTTLYWDFLIRHRQRFAQHPRTALQWRQLGRLDAATQAGIQAQATAHRLAQREARPHKP